MKPLIIYLDKTKKEILTLTKKELEEIVEEAYNKGYEEGQKSNNIWISPTYPWTPSYTSPVTISNTSSSDVSATLTSNGDSYYTIPNLTSGEKTKVKEEEKPKSTKKEKESTRAKIDLEGFEPFSIEELYCKLFPLVGDQDIPDEEE